ncbi:MAG: MarR family winged helix-turn-helix transcriptional regulator [Chthoniobacterales bacterium]
MTNQSNLFYVSPMVPDVDKLIGWYARIYFACHRRHVRDPKTKKVLSAHQASILDHLDEVDGTSLFTLANHLGVTASTMSLSIQRLVDAGYVRRERDQKDARRVQIRLTRAGVRIKQQQSVLDPALVEALLERLSPIDRVAALRGLALFAHAAEELRASLKGTEEPK